MHAPCGGFRTETWFLFSGRSKDAQSVRATFDIDDSMVQRLREEAARRSTTMSALAEAGLRLVLGSPAPQDDPLDRPPLPSRNSGGSKVDIADRDALYRVMEETDD